MKQPYPPDYDNREVEPDEPDPAHSLERLHEHIERRIREEQEHHPGTARPRRHPARPKDQTPGQW